MKKKIYSSIIPWDMISITYLRRNYKLFIYKWNNNNYIQSSKSKIISSLFNIYISYRTSNKSYFIKISLNALIYNDPRINIEIC